MSDLSVALQTAIRSAVAPASLPGGEDLETAFLRVVDPEGKICTALEALGPIVGRDVVVLDAASGVRPCQLYSLGARVTAVRRPDESVPRDRCAEADVRVVAGTTEATGLPAESADVVVSFWSAFLGPDEAQLEEAYRVLRPGGRLLLVHDYGRDDVCDLWSDEFVKQVEWSRRNGPFLGGGFRVRVVHCRWTFESLEEAAALLGAAFGEPGAQLAAAMKRPRLEYNVAVYHRTRDVEPSRLPLAEAPAP